MRSCATCRFVGKRDDGKHICRRSPPVFRDYELLAAVQRIALSVGNAVRDHAPGWPVVAADDVCGQHEPGSTARRAERADRLTVTQGSRFSPVETRAVRHSLKNGGGRVCNLKASGRCRGARLIGMQRVLPPLKNWARWP
jgi:hypothetical protein